MNYHGTELFAAGDVSDHMPKNKELNDNCNNNN
jgi:hypothetical protein